jgi:hypothetical protein
MVSYDFKVPGLPRCQQGPQVKNCCSREVKGSEGEGMRPEVPIPSGAKGRALSSSWTLLEWSQG